MSEPLFLAERRRVIVEQLKQDGRVSVKNLSEELNVSAVTIRQDLRALEKDGLVERTYGGAVLREQPLYGSPELAFSVRQGKHDIEKNTVGRAAAALVQNNWGIALDASTTVHAITPHLKHFDNLTIVTNSLLVAQQFLDTPRIQVLMPAGKLRPDSVSLVGRPDSLPNINLNMGFFGARGLNLKLGATDIDIEEVAMKHALIKRCLQTVVTVDSSKWGQVAPFSFLDVSKIDHIVTTVRASSEQVNEFRKQHVTVDTVPIVQ